MTENSARPNYGIDAPGVIRKLLVIGIALPILGWFVPVVQIGQVTVILRPMTQGMGISLVAGGLLTFAYAKFGKFRHRDRMLKMVDWRGDESVLDVGTGRGLLMIGAAKHLTTGKASGIDIWSKVDLSGNSMAATVHNAELEGVREKVAVLDGNATSMDFPDNTFDLVLSNLCIHNIPAKEGRDKACREIVRVLKPGGRALISDFIHTSDYVKAFRSAGAETTRTGMTLLTFPPLRIVDVHKPSATL